MFDKDRVRLGITPTGWTNDDLPTLGDHISFEQCVSEIALAGFEGCSVGHKFPRDPVVLKEELGRRWLEPDLFRFGASSLLTDIERQLEHHLTGHYSANHRHAMA